MHNVFIVYRLLSTTHRMDRLTMVNMFFSDLAPTAFCGQEKPLKLSV